MKKIIILIIFLILNSINVYSLDKNEYLKLTLGYEKKQDWTAALKIIEKAITEYPDEPNFYAKKVEFLIKTKQYEKAYQFSKKAFSKFNSNEWIINTYKWAILEYGWELNSKKQYAEMNNIFKSGYELFPDYKEMINAYGYSLRQINELELSKKILELGLKKFSDHKNIRSNLSWTYFLIGEKYFYKNEFKLANNYFKTAFDISDKTEIDIYISYLYKLPYLKEFDIALKIFNEAIIKFDNNNKLYEPGYWIYYNLSTYFKDLNKYINAVETLKLLYDYSLKQNKIWKDGLTFTRLAMSKMVLDINSIIEKICPYYRKFINDEKDVLNKLYETFKTDLKPELKFLEYNILGAILYRENKINEARSLLDKAYNSLKLTHKNIFPDNIIKIPFPMKGKYIYGNIESTVSITHMGLLRYHVDIYGTDINGNVYKNNGLSNNDYFGFVKIIYSPVEGEVISSDDNFKDDNPSGEVKGYGNSIMIKDSNGNIYLFCHTKYKSIKVKKGDKVKVGQELAQMGNSGSSVPHLHFGIYSKDWITSLKFNFTGYKKLQPKVKINIWGTNMEMIESK